VITTAGEASDNVKSDHDLLVQAVLLDQAREQANDLRRQLQEYESVAGSKTMTLQVRSLSDLPTALVHARLASGLTQEELAQRIGVSQQQVQRDEQTGYARASLERLQRVWDVLGARLDGRVTLTPALGPDEGMMNPASSGE
jgi:ribosome-binding protein aMBF1 (putative translation factor)